MAISKRLRFRIFERDGFTCTYCGRKAPGVVLEADHIHPRCKGGPDHPDNLTTACVDCNRGKAGVPLTPPPQPDRKCVGGPLQGVVLPASPTNTVLWVFAVGGSASFYVNDEWLAEEGAEADEICTQRFRYGHPGFRCGGTERVKEWADEFENDRDPKLLGFYVTSDLLDEGNAEYVWWDMERMLVELSA